MGRVLEDTGLHMPMGIAKDAVTLGHIDPQSVNLVVANQPNAGNHSSDENLYQNFIGMIEIKW